MPETSLCLLQTDQQQDITGLHIINLHGINVVRVIIPNVTVIPWICFGIGSSLFCQKKKDSWNIEEGCKNTDDMPAYPCKSFFVWQDFTRFQLIATNQIYQMAESSMK